MTQPHGFAGSDKSVVCKLKKAIYGLKQAPRAWYERLTKWKLGKWKWKLFQNQGELWVRVIESKYGRWRNLNVELLDILCPLIGHPSEKL